MKKKYSYITILIILISFSLILISIFLYFYFFSNTNSTKHEGAGNSCPNSEDETKKSDSEIDKLDNEQNDINIKKQELLELEKKVPIKESKEYLSEKEITAYHEAGHTLIALALKYLDDIEYVTIENSSKKGGYLSYYTKSKEKNNKNLIKIEQILISLGGCASQNLLVEQNKMDKNKVNDGCDNDFEKFTQNYNDLKSNYKKSQEEFKQISIKILRDNKTILDAIQKQLCNKITLQKEDLKKIIEKNHISYFDIQKLL